jgi:hypothetical protein
MFQEIGIFVGVATAGTIIGGLLGIKTIVQEDSTSGRNEVGHGMKVGLYTGLTIGTCITCGMYFYNKKLKK